MKKKEVDKFRSFIKLALWLIFVVFILIIINFD